MQRLIAIAGVSLLLAGQVLPVTPRPEQAQQQAKAADEAALERTRQAMGEAFRRGDVAGVMSYHHPDVRKALAYDRPLVGADEVASDLRASFAHAKIDFIEDRVEDLAFHGDVAVQIARFAVRVTPRSGDEPQVYHGRSQVVWVRYTGSPTGWAAWREMVQPML